MKVPSCFYLLTCLLLLTVPALAQERCGTTEALERYLKRHPEAAARARANLQLIPEPPSGRRERIDGLSADSPITLPVVIHFILPPEQQGLVTEADIEWQLQRLNEDFSGLNADSTNASAFYNLRGHSRVRFALATRDPAGQPTNGIDRVAAPAMDFDYASFPALKYTSSCGADAWDTDRYVNIWVGASTTLLGVATFPGLGPVHEQGIVLSLSAFARNPAYTKTPYDGGRTLVHEMGHFLGLYHTWGDEIGCLNSDFRQLPGNCLVSGTGIVGLVNDQSAGDTPQQGGPTTGCPTRRLRDSCNGTPNGILYQNFMDFTSDACYSLFTAAQVERMEHVLANCRPTLMRSDGLLPATRHAQDVSLAAIRSPGQGACLQDGAASLCAGQPFRPSIDVQHLGLEELRTFNVTIELNGQSVTHYTWTGSLAAFEKRTILLPPVTAPNTEGPHELRVLLSLPNGMADDNARNDTGRIQFSIQPPRSLPISEDFESTVFPPSGWKLLNRDNSLSWQRTTRAARTGAAAAGLTFFDYPGPGSRDLLLSPMLDAHGLDSLWLEFSYAYSTFLASTDTLEIGLTTDCGQTFQPVFYQGGDDLVTFKTAEFFMPAANQWKRVHIDLSAYAGRPVQLAFTGINGFGNNLYLDDIRIDGLKKQPLDAALVKIEAPLPQVCAPGARPAFRFRNAGLETLRNLEITYRIDKGDWIRSDWSGALAPGAEASLEFSSVHLGSTGSHVLEVATALPNGSIDNNQGNDTLRLAYFVRPVLPLGGGRTESFSRFPITGWQLTNPNGDRSWQFTDSAGHPVAGAVRLPDWGQAIYGRTDELVLPAFTFSGIDSLHFHFNLASAAFRRIGGTAPVDTLTILASDDCGNTFVPVYKKWGNGLRTIPGSGQPLNRPLLPVQSDWRKDSIDLTPLIRTHGGGLTLAFRFEGHNRNHLYLDEVELRPRILPLVLKERGVLVLPNPFRQAFVLWHHQPPVGLKRVRVTNAQGQVVWQRQFRENAPNYLTIDLGGQAAGPYFLEAEYADGQPRFTAQLIKQ